MQQSLVSNIKDDDITKILKDKTAFKSNTIVDDMTKVQTHNIVFFKVAHTLCTRIDNTSIYGDDFRPRSPSKTYTYIQSTIAYRFVYDVVVY